MRSSNTLKSNIVSAKTGSTTRTKGKVTQAQSLPFSLIPIESFTLFIPKPNLVKPQRLACPACRTPVRLGP